ncbi:MAG: hypothetical protein QXJ62_05460 [Nitrososphaeria archaeon]
MTRNWLKRFTFNPIRREDLKAVVDRIKKVAQILREHEDAVKAIVTAIAVGLGILLIAYLIWKTK